MGAPSFLRVGRIQEGTESPEEKAVCHLEPVGGPATRAESLEASPAGGFGLAVASPLALQARDEHLAAVIAGRPRNCHSMSHERTRVLFVCMGNICRSPLAESVFRHLARERGVEDRFEVDSAGTSGYHEGDPPDRRSVATARERGVTVTGSSRPLTERDLRDFDYLIVMDAENRAHVDRLRATVEGSARVHRLREWDPERSGLDVPDPYYGGPRGFEDVHDIVERSCAALLDHLLAEYGRPS